MSCRIAAPPRREESPRPCEGPGRLQVSRDRKAGPQREGRVGNAKQERLTLGFGIDWPPRARPVRRARAGSHSRGARCWPPLHSPATTSPAGTSTRASRRSNRATRRMGWPASTDSPGWTSTSTTCAAAIPVPAAPRRRSWKPAKIRSGRRSDRRPSRAPARQGPGLGPPARRGRRRSYHRRSTSWRDPEPPVRRRARPCPIRLPPWRKPGGRRA